VSAIEPLRREHLETATTTLARAFDDEPMFRWIFPDPQHRAYSLQVLNRVPLTYGLRFGGVTQSHEGKAVALWLPPGGKATAGRMMRCGMLGVPFRVGLGAFAKFAIANEIMGKLHTRHVPEPHWHLMIVGVDPELQGRGVGTALVKEGLARADQENVPCFLETSRERNLAFYERLGFAVVETTTLGRGGPKAWGMRRERGRRAMVV
jgi:ribosomal protein S18 acetylase RimI-like enzyme